MNTILHSKPTIGKEEISAVRKVLLSGQLTQGRQVELLEKKICQLSQQKYAAAVNSGSSALHLTLLALGIKKGEEVIIPSYVCQALLNAIYYIDAKPKLVDVSLMDYNIEIKEIKKALTSKCKAIIVPHMFGVMANVDEIKKIGLPVIEDCAMSIGTSLKGKPAGSFGDLAIFSFYATKMLAAGEGGAVATPDKKLIEKIFDYREYDVKKKYHVRYNYKLSDINATIAVEQIKKLKIFIKQRKKIAEHYNKYFKSTELIIPKQHKHKDNIYYRYIVRTDKVDNLRKYLKAKKIICGHGVMVSLHQLLNIKKGFSNTNRILNTAISLPIYPSLTLDEQRRVITEIISYLKR